MQVEDDSASPTDAEDLEGGAAGEVSGGTSSGQEDGDKSANSSDAGSDSKPDGKGDPEGSLLDAVTAALKLPEKDKGVSSAPDTQKDPKDKPASDEDEGIPKEFSKHPRWQQIYKERNEAKAQVAELTAQNAEIKDSSDRFNALASFLEEHKVPSDQAANAMRLTALSHSDPEIFYAELSAMYEDWTVRMGKGLPADLQKEVDDGYLSEERAKELAKARLESKHATGQVQRHQENDKQRTEQERREAVKNLQAKMGVAVHTWEKSVITSDPDYVSKTKPFVIDRMARIVRDRGKPLNGEADIVAVAKEAYAAVNKELGGLRGAKPNTRQVRPAGGNNASPSQAPEPKNLQDVVARALAG